LWILNFVSLFIRFLLSFNGLIVQQMSENRFGTDTCHECTKRWRGKKHLEELDVDRTTNSINTGRDLMWFYGPMTRSSVRSRELSRCRTNAEFLSTNENFWYVTPCRVTDTYKLFRGIHCPSRGKGWPMADEAAVFSGTSTYVYLTRCHHKMVISSTLKTGAADTPETSVNTPGNTWSYNSTRRRTSEAQRTSGQLLLKLRYGSTHMTCRKCYLKRKYEIRNHHLWFSQLWYGTLFWYEVVQTAET